MQTRLRAHDSSFMHRHAGHNTLVNSPFLLLTLPIRIAVPDNGVLHVYLLQADTGIEQAAPLREGGHTSEENTISAP